MPGPVTVCPDHGHCEGERCPVCDRHLQPVLSGDRRRRLSKYLSGALRHFPDDAGIELDDSGWTDSEELVAAVERKYGWADERAVEAVVAMDPKGRFESDGRRVRAAYGHSVDVDLESGDTPVPDTLYHGTAPRHLDSIFEEGLRSMSRQQVHLSGTVESAREVGSRHADEPAIIEVDAAAMLADGHEITKRGTDVYTTDRVPPAYLRRR